MIGVGFTGATSEKVAELIHQFFEVVELLEEEIRVESEKWEIEVVVARSLGQRVSTEAMVCEFQQRARLKGLVVAFNLNQGHLMF